MPETVQLLQAFQHELMQHQQRAVLLCPHGYRLPLDQQTPLVLDDQADDRYAMHRYRDYLGANNSLVVLNFQHSIHADALAALAGTVTAGGLLIINLPQHVTAFTERLLRLAEHFTLVIQVSHASALRQAYQRLSQRPISVPLAPTFPTPMQQQIMTAMLNQPECLHLLMADRGRGKSTTLGAALAQYSGPERLIVTAPKRSQVNGLLQQANGRAEFIAWERLLELPSTAIRLVIDEAAGLPIHILQQLCQRFKVWGLATTVEGYEGCGRGFVIRFLTWLGQQQQYVQHQLEQPLRWRAPDDCEEWLERLLCMRDKPTSEQWQDGYHWLHASQLRDEQLQQVMQLLLEAHYQSSPNDLRLLLDDERQKLLILCQQGALVGLVWLAQEGPVPAHLHSAIVAGNRRPAGDLLPQALAYNWQQSEPLQWRWWRIVRIAITAGCRRNGHGSALLARIRELAWQHQIDALGSSFGAAPDVLSFWQTNQFELVHRGHKRQMASGYINAMVALGCSEIVQQSIAQRVLPLSSHD
ncbi:GNAT family N-acetyltransferase [Pseudidiomarina mangrovi]|uniref:GNAT family N-acetyltransferase n=1 Tax=Pseudidiomarina mangrovi TaxID=2487133 RepID=UPI000FC9DE38|nr:GNAT family N-acetyltransferase [Pseudidiomarina mangrovi]